MMDILSFQALSGWGGIIFSTHLLNWETFLDHSQSAVVAQNVSFILDKQRLNRDTGPWLDELSKNPLSIQLVGIKRVWEKNGVTAPMGACKVFLRLRCFAQYFCVSLTHTDTHTPVWTITFTQSWWSVAERFFMPCQHAWQPPRQHPQHHNRRLVVL